MDLHGWDMVGMQIMVGARIKHGWRKDGAQTRHGWGVRMMHGVE